MLAAKRFADIDILPLTVRFMVFVQFAGNAPEVGLSAPAQRFPGRRPSEGRDHKNRSTGSQ